LLKNIPPEYTENLRYYKENGYLTSSVTLNTTMVFMEELLKPVPVDERAVQRIIAMGATPEDAADWKQAYEDLHAIEAKVEEFNKVCWPDIKKKNDKSIWTCLRFTHEDIALLSMYTAGRILMTIGPIIMNGKIFVSIIGDGSEIHKGKEGKYRLNPEGKYSRQFTPCGFQGIHATKEKAIEFFNIIMSNWDKEKYCVYKSENVGIC
jgi:hypothetical protein